MNSVLSDVINSERNCLPINPDDIGNTKNCDSSKLSESNLNTHPSPNHSAVSPPPLSLQPAVKITDKDDGVDNKNCRNDVLDDRDLQNCDISISPPGIIQTSSSSSTSYVYTKKSEISKNHFEETLRTREISSFYDISNSSTVWTFPKIYWEINSLFITSTLYWIQCNVKKCTKWTGQHEDGAAKWPIRSRYSNHWPIRGQQRSALRWRVRDVTLFKLQDYKAYLHHCSDAAFQGELCWLFFCF